ncbi:MAG: phospholipase A [Neisseria sp.]|nr:phospholipase A [Neisseria sp.]
MRDRIKIEGVKALLLLSGLPAAYAADPVAMQCTLLKDDALRLACFDKIYAAQLPPAKPIEFESGEAESKSLDLVKSISSSLENKDAVLVFSPLDKPAGESFEPSEKLIEAADAYTPLSNLFDLDENSADGLLAVREHQPMYLMPVWYNSSPNTGPHSPTRGKSDAERFRGQKRTEAKMQVSFKTKVIEDLFGTRADLWFGYTQKSDWQVWSQGKKSAPFRNSDYAPEMLLTQPVKAQLPLRGKLRMLGAGFVHESNGQSRPESRSWNRAYAMVGMEWGRLTVMPRIWIRMFDAKGDKDDNPDIVKYMGYGDLRMFYRFNKRHTLTGMLRYNPASGKGAAEAAYTFPLKGKLKAYVRGFHGYGESLVDYNHKQTGIGFGLMFRDWDGI